MFVTVINFTPSKFAVKLGSFETRSHKTRTKVPEILDGFECFVSVLKRFYRLVPSLVQA